MEMLREGGEWLGAARNWIKWNVPRGDRLKWGSNEEVTLRVNQIEELAAHVAAAASEMPRTDITAITNERDHLKEVWLQACAHVAEACTILGLDQNTEAPDSWALRDWATRIRRERDAAVAAIKVVNETPIAKEIAAWHELVARTVNERDNIKAENTRMRKALDLILENAGTPSMVRRLAVQGTPSDDSLDSHSREPK